MYTFSDPKVIDCLHRVVNAFGKIGEHVDVVATHSSLQLSITNSSLTVLGRTTFVRPLFSGGGVAKNVQIKARAADFIFKRLESEEVLSLHLRFETTRSGQEELKVQLDCKKGIVKIFRVACLQTAISPADFEPIGARACSLQFMPSVLREAFASCEAGADELKISFQHNLVNLLARKRGKVKSDSLVLRSGLRTIINLQPETFRQITVRIPRQLELKLKEFRVMLAFFEQLGAEAPISASFHDSGVTTPVVFRGSAAAIASPEFEFKFMAKISIPRLGDSGQPFLRVGPQPEWAAGHLREPSASARHEDSALRHARQERERRMRRIVAAASASAVSTSVSSASSSALPRSFTEAFSPPASASVSSFDHTGERQNLSAEEQPEFNPDISEVGLTQGTSAQPVRGLFD